ncbi:WXG100 family type VII secretion target [Mycobacterium sp. URHD0025]|uniref:WXG100 family type VII secretion target n=1 Tax=Mycobacterium sp. URHD0025 TaxID=1298864 RepID=UPI000491C452|nr:WXG100 family type VII secretion target [Mycobacterium sp. URHD0025]
MSRYTVDLDRLQDFIGRLVQFHSRAEQVAVEVDQQVAALHGTWAGDAAEAHKRQHDEWTEAAAQMRAALEQLRTKIDAAHRSYAGAVALNTAMWP